MLTATDFILSFNRPKWTVAMQNVQTSKMETLRVQLDKMVSPCKVAAISAHEKVHGRADKSARFCHAVGLTRAGSSRLFKSSQLGTKMAAGVSS